MKPHESTCPIWLKNLFFASVVVVVVLGWRLVIYAKERQTRKLVKELVSVTKIVNHPVPNHAGTQLLYAQSTESGVGVFLKDLTTAKKQRLLELGESQILSGSLAMLTWSPDDQLCAYAAPIKGKKQKVVLCNARDGSSNASLIAVGYIDQFCWMRPDCFAYLNNSKSIHVVSRAADGKWMKSNALTNFSGGPVTHFTAISSTTLAWKQDGAIWKWVVSTNVPVELWNPGTNHLVSFYYSPETEKLLLNLSDGQDSNRLLSLHPQTGDLHVLNRINLPMVLVANWINSGKGYAFRSSDHWGDTLYISPDGLPSLKKVFSEGDVVEYRTSADKVYIFGSEGIEPPGVWEYDPASNDARCVVRSTDNPFSFTKKIAHSSVIITNGSREIQAQLWGPANSSAKHQYPLIITQSPYRWSPYPNMAALSGYYFLSMNRRSWEIGIENWESDVMAAYHEFAKKPQIDTNRVYLFGHSAETSPISNLAAEQPDLWKGALMQSPTELPDPMRSRMSAILIDAGERDPGAQERLSAYQSEAAKHGLAARIVIHPNARHTSWSRTTEEAKVEELANFLSRN